MGDSSFGADADTAAADTVVAEGGTRKSTVPPEIRPEGVRAPEVSSLRSQCDQLTRWADDWVVTCRTLAEANSALAQATKILGKLGVTPREERGVETELWPTH
jgi:RNA-directed DNA polymerase